MLRRQRRCYWSPSSTADPTARLTTAVGTLARPVAQFPSLKARELRRVLARAPLSYQAKRSTGGSHTVLKSATGHPDLLWSFHDGHTLAPGLVRKILVRDVGLSEQQARDLL